MRVLEARKEARWADAAKLEEQAADPLMPYFAPASEDDSVVLFDGQVALPPAQHGLPEVVCSARFSRTNDAAFEGVLRQVKTSNGVAIGKWFGFRTGVERGHAASPMRYDLERDQFLNVSFVEEDF